MGILDIFKRSQIPQVETEKRSTDESVFGLALNYNGYSTYKTSQSLALSAVYRCVNVLVNSIASLPVKVYRTTEDGYKYEVKNDLYYILAKKPNKKMNNYTFYSLIVKDILLSGNAYALILRKDGKVVGLQYVQPGLVNPIDKIDHIEYQVAGLKGIVREEDILHFMNFTDNGVYGISVLTHAKRTLGIADFGDKSSENWFKSGGCTSGFLKFTSPSNGKQREEILSAWNQATGGPNSVGPNGIAVLPSNVEYTQLSISPADAQLLDSRKFEVIEICRFFGVPPFKVFDLEKSSYNNSEMAELSFLNDTLRPLITKIENEIETKLFKEEDKLDVKFDVNEMLRTDKKSQAEYYTKLFTIGAITSNEVRKELDMTPVDGGDDALVQVNLCKLKNIGNYNNADQDNRLKEDNIQNNNDK